MAWRLWRDSAREAEQGRRSTHVRTVRGGTKFARRWLFEQRIATKAEIEARITELLDNAGNDNAEFILDTECGSAQIIIDAERPAHTFTLEYTYAEPHAADSGKAGDRRA